MQDKTTECPDVQQIRLQKLVEYGALLWPIVHDLDANMRDNICLFLDHELMSYRYDLAVIFLLLGWMIASKTDQGSIVWNRIGRESSRNVLQENTHPPTESEFQHKVIISRRQPWRYFTHAEKGRRLAGSAPFRLNPIRLILTLTLSLTLFLTLFPTLNIR